MTYSSILVCSHDIYVSTSSSHTDDRHKIIFKQIIFIINIKDKGILSFLLKKFGCLNLLAEYFKIILVIDCLFSPFI